MMWLRLYRGVLHPGLMLAMRCVALWSPKVRRGLEGRRRWREQLGEARLEADGRRIHIHAASVGEFEQAKPLIERLRADAKPMVITASFFSPSGFEQQGCYSLLDGACYLPFDRVEEVRAFFDHVAPDLIIIIRYDLWPVFLQEAKRRSVPSILVCGVLRESSARLLPVLRGFFRRLYDLLTAVHVVGAEDAAAFHRLGIHSPVVVSGDTRYDRVLARARAQADLSWIDTGLVAGRVTLVAGSTWPADEELLAGLRNRPDLLLVLVPHEPTAEHVAALRDRFPGAVTATEIEAGSVAGAPPAVIVDRTGILAALYRIATIAYVGGGFGEGVHSVLEPAAYGMPVISGPRIERSRDATALSAAGSLLVIGNAAELEAAVADLLADIPLRTRLAQGAGRFVAERLGATDRIHEWLAGAGVLGAVEQPDDGRGEPR